jgi:hypothetical protein|tara:strand:- start:493 stop:696 length:204 start_codon:yes stop_codon:yes gene_type:complete
MKVIIEMDVDNSAFDDESTEARRILAGVGDMIDNHAYLGPWNKNLKDINGNTVGFFKVIDEQGRELA